MILPSLQGKPTEMLDEKVSIYLLGSRLFDLLSIHILCTMKPSHHRSNTGSPSASPPHNNKDEDDVTNVMNDLPSEETLLQAACQKLGGEGDTFLIRNSLHVSRTDRHSKRGGKRPSSVCQR